MEMKLYFGILLLIVITGSAESFQCAKENGDGSRTTITCHTGCCGSVRDPYCCSQYLPQPNKRLATGHVAAIITVIVVSLVAVIAFSLYLWCREFLRNRIPSSPSPERKPRERTQKSAHNTGLSTGLGQSAFPSRLHPTFFHGFGRREVDLDSMEPRVAPSDYGGASLYGGYFSSQAGASPI